MRTQPEGWRKPRYRRYARSLAIIAATWTVHQLSRFACLAVPGQHGKGVGLFASAASKSVVLRRQLDTGSGQVSCVGTSGKAISSSSSISSSRLKSRRQHQQIFLGLVVLAPRPSPRRPQSGTTDPPPAARRTGAQATLAGQRQRRLRLQVQPDLVLGTGARAQLAARLPSRPARSGASPCGFLRRRSYFDSGRAPTSALRLPGQRPGRRAGAA